MSTSGTTTWSLNRDAVIGAALRKLGVLSGGSTPEAYQVTNASQALNAMIKGFQADGMPVWATRANYFYTQTGVAAYDVGPSLAINTSQPLKIIQAWYLQSGGTNVPMNIYTQYDYNVLPLPNSSGTPINLYYHPLNNSGIINLWPIPNDDTTAIGFVYQRPFEDMNSATDDFDFPPYWTEALIYGLAWRLAPEYGIPAQERTMIKNEAEYFHQYALSFGTEEGSITFQPDSSGRRT